MSIEWMNRVFNTSLEPTDRLVMLAIADNASHEGLLWPSVPTTARRTGLSERSVQRVLQRFMEAGYLELEQEASQHRPRLYRLVSLPSRGDRGDNDDIRGDNDDIRGDNDDIPGVTDSHPNHQGEPSKIEPPDSAVVVSKRKSDARFALMNQLWEQAIGMPPNLASGEVIGEILDQVDPPAEWLAPAFRIMASANVRRLTYVRAILTRWKTDGFFPSEDGPPGQGARSRQGESLPYRSKRVIPAALLAQIDAEEDVEADG